MPWWRRRDAAAESKSVVDTSLPLIRLEHVSKIFRGDADEETRALDDISLDIQRGEFVAVSGPSGCGKSTLLSILALLDTPTKGRYWLDGRDTDTLSPGERARVRNLDVGLIFQSFNLIGDLTVFENVEYPLTVRGVAPADRKARVDAALERVGLSARAKSRPGSLSGGHQQLVAVARAITGRPLILLADEPTGNLDSKSGESLMRLFNELHAAGATVCVVTHDPRWMAQAKRHIELFDGRLRRLLGAERNDRVD
ncbi:MAG TPA: ABC transporter ATP-binding protein [Vicinamibacterales bacterium]|nr:ABC transporter ATP-binding protein [Vicinamibacterales bacterium]